MPPRYGSLFGIVLILFAVGGLIVSGLRAGRPGDNASDHLVPPAATVPRLAVYFIRARVDCASCIKMKAWTRAVLDADFNSDMLAGELVTHTVYYDNPSPRDAALVKAFDIYTQSIVLAEEDASGIRRSKNLTRVWELLRDRPAFTAYIRTELVAFRESETPAAPAIQNETSD